MADIRLLQAADRERWDAYVCASELSHFGQRTAWKDLTERAYGVPAYWWLAEDGGRITGVLPLFAKGGRTPQLFSAPGGLLADSPEIAAALLEPAREEMRRRNMAWIELRDQKTAWPGLETNDEHVTMVLTLAENGEAQWKAFDAKLRNQIRKGEKAGFERKWNRDAATFHRVLLENMRDLGSPIRNTRYYEGALAALGDDAELLVIEREREAAGVMFTVRHAGTMTDPWASSLRRFFTHCPNQVLYWEALQRAFALGMKRFDFGRSQWNSGTFAFKRQWGAEPVQLHYQYVLGTAKTFPTLSAQKGSLDTVVQLWKKLPIPVAGFLGEPAKRMFPEVL